MTNSPYQPYRPDSQGYNQAAAPQYAPVYSQPPGAFSEPRDSYSTDSFAQPSPAQLVPVYGPASAHPNASVVLIMGILGWFFFPLSVIGLVMGIKAHKDMTNNPRAYAPSSSLTIGLVLSAINAGLVAIAVGFFLLLLLFA